MPGRVYVVFAKAATGLKEWPIAAFFNSEAAADAAAAFAEHAIRSQHVIVTTSGRCKVVRADVRSYASWSSVPSLAKGF